MTADTGAPERIGKYELGTVLGTGTCGTVYRARDPFVGRDVAIKVTQSRIDLAAMETRLLYYRTFAETLIHRLAVTSARLSAALQKGGGRAPE